MPAKKNSTKTRRRKRKATKTINYKKRAATDATVIVRSKFTPTVVAVGVSTMSSNGQTYSLSQMESYGNLAALYDQYRIVEIKEEFIPQADASTLGTNIPLFGHIVDHDDATPVGTVYRWQNDPRAVIKLMRGPRNITFRPRLDAHVGNISSAGMIEGKMWLTTDQPTAAHYGLKWALFNDGTSVNYHLYRRTTYVVEFRHPKSV